MKTELARNAADPFPYLQDNRGMSALIRTLDWNETTIGDPQQWPESLHAAVNISLNSGFPIAIYWGEDFSLIYNDAWSSIPGNKHPWALGKPGRIVWPEIWEGLDNQFKDALHNGNIIRSPDSLLLMQRFGYTEECYFDYSLSPIRDASGGIGGVFNAVIETTYRVLNERRNRILNQFAKLVNQARSRNDAFTMLRNLLDTVYQDIPFCLVYVLKNARNLEITSGMDAETAAEIEWPFDMVKKTTSSYTISPLPSAVADATASFWPEPCVEALLIPLKNSMGAMMGYMIAGVNPRKRLDNEYKHFFESVAGYIATTIANGGIVEDEAAIRKQLVQREESLRKKIEEQLKLVTLVNNSVELMSILELDGKNSYVNPAGMRMLGFDTFEQVLTTPIAHLHEAEDIAFVQANVLPEVMQVGRWSGPMNVKHLKTGEVFPVYNNAIRIDDPETGKPIAIGAVMRDLRPELAAQKALIESEQNLRNIITHAPVAMCIIVGPEYVIDIANDKMIALWGKTGSDVTGKPVFEAVPEARSQGLEEVLLNVYQTGQSFYADERAVQLQRGDNIETVYLNFTYEPYRDADGETVGILAVAHDVTAQVVARQEIEAMVNLRTLELADANSNLIKINQELTRTNTNLGEFAYAASHDLKEPARKIHVFADRLRNLLSDRLTKEEIHYFERMMLASSRMTTLISDLLTYSEVNQHSSAFEDVDLKELIQQVLVDLELEIEQKQASVSLGDFSTVKGNPRHLQQVFHNLISNALKYTKPETSPVIAINGNIKIGRDLDQSIGEDDKKKNFLEIIVADNGIGFDSDDAERIFNVFTRLHDTPGDKGTGVGLSIVRKVIQNHNGFVWARSTKGMGSTFYVALPL